MDDHDTLVPRLADGSPPASPESLLALFDELGIAHRTRGHQPMFTVTDSKAFRVTHGVGHTKNLFLRNKKGRMWLVTCHEDRAVDLRVLGDRLGAGRLSFGSARRLMERLGVTPGAVSPLALVNDRDNAVEFVMERMLAAADALHFHPLDNARTTTMTLAGLERLLARTGHAIRWIDLDAPPAPDDER